ncbi:hypothetical protein [Tenuibacillus multivorans]|uniref:Uncharacterized protein n=1 Tax=Tenuibacillus multivorans TaxID=237069 RepID=A0A1H0GA61_9BACI|nr:hypothetical protein [Tenuibacillus multivorans]GEL78795.1 hypothetical protein TMU01_30300 [Tenuibacillus multivorans]SDO03762.1 hypothetical protein SAMN05216498_0506 [Tenuibacillus multivorans]
MAKPDRRNQDSRSEFDIDIDRMLNEGLAGGYVRPTYNRAQIEGAHEIRKNDEPFSTPDETHND